MEPVYLVTHRPILQYIHEYAQLEDLGLNGPCGVVPVISDILHWSQTGVWQDGRKLNIECPPWLDEAECGYPHGRLTNV